MPAFLNFQHPRLVPEPPDGPSWIHEIKFDGYRLQLRVEHGSVTVWTRNGHDWTDRFLEIVAETARLPDCIVDGELVALNLKGQPDFSALRASISPGKTGRLVLFVFDILWRVAEAAIEPGRLNGGREETPRGELPAPRGRGSPHSTFLLAARFLTTSK